MDEKFADEIFELSIEAQRIEDRKWAIRQHLGQLLNKGGALSWDAVSILAMKCKMEKLNVNA